MAANPTDETVARLKAGWPQWQIWTVLRAVGGTIWCARRWDGTGPVLNADSADELTESLEGDVSP
jgi:hypothetical protein